MQDYMALHPVEEATFRAFIIPAKRDRLVMLFGSARRRKRARGQLNHFRSWDPRYARPVPSTADVLALLRQAGAPSECHLVSDDPDLDGRDLPLEEAVAAAEDCGLASVLCCVPGRLAFFFDEGWVPRHRILLRRALGAC